MEDQSAVGTQTAFPPANGEIQSHELLDNHLFSNAMIDNILGPVAFYSLRGQELDVVRYNKKFLDEVKIPELRDHLQSIQQLVYEDDLPLLYDLFERAEANRQGGAIGVVRFRRSNGSILQFRFHLYYAKTEETGKLFYSSVHDLAQFITPEDQRRLFSQAFNSSVVFLRRKGVDWSFAVVVHGLEQDLGISSDELQFELNSGSFEKRIAPNILQQMKQIIIGAKAQTEYFSPPFDVTASDGTTISLQVRFFRVQDEHSGVNYVLTFRKSDTFTMVKNAD